MKKNKIKLYVILAIILSFLTVYGGAVNNLSLNESAPFPENM